MAFPLIAAVRLSFVLRYAARSTDGGIPPVISRTCSTRSSPSSPSLPGCCTASYSLVGEKSSAASSPSWRPQFTDLQILLGKAVAALAPVLAVEIGAVTLMATTGSPATCWGHSYFPNATMWLILLLVVPLSATLAVEFNVIVSSRVSTCAPPSRWARS